MRPARVHRRRSFWLDLFACFLIPAYTLLFAGSVEWFGTNFSVIAVTGEDHYWGFVYWGVLAGGYFAVMLTKLALILPRLWQRIAVCLLTLLACLALGYALAIPYLPDDFPGFASLHVVLAAGACAGAGGHRQDVLAVDHHNKASLFAIEELFNHDAVACVAKGVAGQHIFDRRFGFLEGHRHDNAFTRRQTVGFDDDRCAFLAQVSQGWLNLGKVLILRRRDVMTGEEIFGEGF